MGGSTGSREAGQTESARVNRHTRENDLQCRLHAMLEGVVMTLEAI